MKFKLMAVEVAERKTKELRKQVDTRLHALIAASAQAS